MEFSEIYAYSQHLRVLYVEDDAALRESTLYLLENYFESIDFAVDGQDGLNRYSLAYDSGERYDLVLTDINMPYLNGLQMSEEIYALYPEQSVIVFTAHNENAYMLDAIKLGIDGFLLKPLDLSELNKTFYKVCKQIYHQKNIEWQNEQNERYQAALKEWSNVDYMEVDTSIHRATEITAKTLHVGRVGVWLVDNDHDILVCDDVYVLADDTHESGIKIAQDGISPEYLQKMLEGNIVIVDDTHQAVVSKTFTNEYLLKYNVASALIIPILHDNELRGLISLESLEKPRQWRFDEEDFAMMIANNVALSLEIKYRKNIQLELKKQKEALEHQAHHDILTNLPNRLLFMDRLSHAIEFAKRQETSIAVLFIDLDRFKEINDSLGHSIGDKVLEEVSKRLKSQIRESDTLARLGGDEFTLMIEGLIDNTGVVEVVQKLMRCMKDPIYADGRELYVTLSIGITLFPNDGNTVEQLLKNADSAMYKAKEDGKNTYHFYTYDMTKNAIERINLEIAFRKALENEEFTVYYQPQMNGATNKLVGMEALVRWKRSATETVPPNVFIPLAEETGLIVTLDRWVMCRAMKQFSQWYEQGLQPGVLSLNLTMKQLQTVDFIDFLKQMFEETAFKPQWLELEVTEGQIMKNPESTIKTLEAIKSFGVKLAIDDFGTGYSSLSYLKRLPIDTLKIDRSFISELPYDEEDVAISKAVIALAKSLNLIVIGEGVETFEQKDFLVQNGCQLIQGYYYDKPMNSYEMELKLKLLLESQESHQLYFEI